MNETTNVQSYKNVKVFYRIFPMYKMLWDDVKILENRKTLFIRCLQDKCLDKTCLKKYWKFETDGIFYNNSQEDVYDAVLDGVLDRILEGNNAVVLNFGQTGCGKTLTATGLYNNYKDRGIALRLIGDLFRMKKCLKEKLKICVQMSYIETKQTYFGDLLSNNYGLNLHNIKDVTVVTVENEDVAMKLLFTAEARREFADDSETSHSANGVLSLTIITKPVHYSNPTITAAKIYIVDLAGVDYYGNSTASHKNLFELNKGNRTKFNLQQFLLGVINNDAECIVVKRRLDILLQYLKDALNGHSILRLIGHIRVDKANLLLSLSTLRFGQILYGTKPVVLKPNLTKDKDFEIQFLKKKLIEAQKEEDLNFMIGCNAHNISQDRIQQMQHIAQQYLLGNTNEMVICSVTDIAAVLKIFKDLYKKLDDEKVESTKLAYENAYKEALTNLQKSDSITSPKGFKRSSKITKTKDNNNNNKKLSQGSLTSKPMSSKADVSKSMLFDRGSTASKSGKRSRLSINVRKKATSRRKSTDGSDVSPIHEVEEDDVTIPSLVPRYSEAWDAFVHDLNNNYHELEEEKLITEKSVKEAQRAYLDEVKLLQTRFELLDIRKFELQKAEMVKLFRKKNCEVLSDNEKNCIENLQSATEELLYQQEKVLKQQSEFVVRLKSYLHVKKEIDEKFNDFCQKNYNVLLAQLDSTKTIQKAEDVVGSSFITEDDIPPIVLQDEEACDTYTKLQKNMKREIRRLKLLQKVESKKHF